MKKNNKKQVLILVVIAFILAGVQTSGNKYFLSSFAQAKNSPYETATVVRVVDGDTIAANINGQEKKIRFIGVNTPESVGEYKNNPQPGGVEASNFTKEQLKKGQTIYLTSDASNTDKYGRLLRYIWIDKPDETKINTSMFNAILLEKGYADTMRIEPNVKYADVFQELDNGSIN